MTNITRYVWGEHGMYKDTCGYYVDAKEYDRLTAQLAEVKGSIGKQVEAKDKACAALMNRLAERDDVLSARFNENKELYMHWQQALTENTTLRTKLAECEKEVDRLNQMLHQTSQGNAELIGEVIQEARKQAVRECIAIVDSYIGTDHICAEIAETFGLEE